ncbi:UNVERIFIED_CONTAM: hypothetical protein PYX00_005939 [Menopon gallinae]|uniref:Ribosomal protein S13 n=1 Tax=Menopon gallinae TaxID=328185 RepID=A0AAW2HTE7_9NEOP
MGCGPGNRRHEPVKHSWTKKMNIFGTNLGHAPISTTYHVYKSLSGLASTIFNNVHRHQQQQNGGPNGLPRTSATGNPHTAKLMLEECPRWTHQREILSRDVELDEGNVRLDRMLKNSEHPRLLGRIGLILQKSGSLKPERATRGVKCATRRKVR